MNICNLSVGHFEFVLVEAVVGFKSGASPYTIVTDIKRKPYAKFGTFVPLVTVILLSHLTNTSILWHGNLRNIKQEYLQRVQQVIVPSHLYVGSQQYLRQ